MRITITPRLPRTNDDARVHRQHAVFVNQNRIDIDFLHMRQFAHQFRHPQQQALQRLHIHWRHIAEFAQHLGGTGTPDHVRHQKFIQRRQRHRAIGNHFNGDATGAK